MSLFEELKRRNVFRVAIAYVIVAWLLMQVADTLAPALRLPEWFQSGVLFILIIGFPLAIIFAWAFELTPEGLQREKDVDRARSITHLTGQKLNVTIIGLLAIAVVYLALDNYVFERDDPEEAVATQPSIAVLPFTNMSDDASNEFFADGVTEELLNLLTKIPELQVTSRTSAFQFKGKDLDIPAIAKRLGVEHVLEGSVRKSGTRVRITAQLIDAATDRHVWSSTYDRELDDIFAIQDEIARMVVDQLHVTLLGEAPKVTTTDTQAYATYLEGLHYLDRDTEDHWHRAKMLFEDVIDTDPNYAPAWYGRAQAIREMANFGLVDLDEGTALAREWTERALSLDPTLAEAWAWLAHIALSYDWDWQSASELIDTALQMGPNNPAVLEEAARLHQVLGQADRMLEYAERALVQDPLSKRRLELAGKFNWFAGNWDRAMELFEKNDSLHGRDAFNPDLWSVLIIQGRYDEAASRADALASWEDDFIWNVIRAFAVYPAGRVDESDEALRWVIDNVGIPLGYQIAEMYALRRNVDKAFEWLEISYEHRDGGLTYLLLDPWMEPLHDDPRWRPFLEKMNLLEYWDEMPGRNRKVH